MQPETTAFVWGTQVETGRLVVLVDFSEKHKKW